MLSDAEMSQFLEDCLMLNTTESVASFASSSDAYSKLRSAIESGTLTGPDIEAFVKNLLRDFQPGRVFYGDKLLALVAQVVIRGPQPFSGRYLSELTALDCAELPISPRVAALGLKEHRRLFPETTAKTWSLSNSVRYDRIELFDVVDPEPPTNSSIASGSIAWVA